MPPQLSRARGQHHRELRPGEKRRERVKEKERMLWEKGEEGVEGVDAREVTEVLVWEQPATVRGACRGLRSDR